MRPSKRDKLGAELSAYLDGELDAAHAAQIEGLLNRSQAARRQLAELKTVREQLRGLPLRKAPAELAQAVRRRLERQALLEPSRPGRLRRVLPWLATLSAAAVILMAVGLWQRARPAAPAASGPGNAKREALARRPATSAPSDATAAAVAQAAPPARPREPDAPEAPAPPAVGGERVAAGSGRPLTDATGSRRDEKAPRKPLAYRPASDLLTGPQLELVLRPEDSGQYVRALRVIDQWHGAAPAVVAGDVSGAPVLADGHGSGRSPHLRWAARLTVMQTRQLLDQLGRTCPDAVEVTLRFAPRDMTLVQALVGARQPEAGGLVWSWPASTQPGRPGVGVPAPRSGSYYATRAYPENAGGWGAVGRSGLRESRRSATPVGGRLLMVSMDELAQRWMARGPDYAREAVEFIGQTARSLLNELWTSASVVDVQVRISPPPASQTNAPGKSDLPADPHPD